MSVARPGSPSRNTSSLAAPLVLARVGVAGVPSAVGDTAAEVGGVEGGVTVPAALSLVRRARRMGALNPSGGFLDVPGVVGDGADGLSSFGGEDASRSTLSDVKEGKRVGALLVISVLGIANFASVKLGNAANGSAETGRGKSGMLVLSEVRRAKRVGVLHMGADSDALDVTSVVVG